MMTLSNETSEGIRIAGTYMCITVHMHNHTHIAILGIALIPPISFFLAILLNLLYMLQILIYLKLISKAIYIKHITNLCYVRKNHLHNESSSRIREVLIVGLIILINPHYYSELVILVEEIGCLHSLDWTGILDWTTGLNYFSLLYTSGWFYWIKQILLVSG